MEMDASFGAWLRRRRRALDLTQDVLAERVNCSVATIRKIEADERRPSREVAELLADALGIPPAERATFLQVARGQRSTDRLAAVAAPPVEPPPAQVETPVPTQRVPHPLTRLTGRTAELAELHHLLQMPECRLLTLVGLGGIGKTRLAQAAALLPLDFADGVYFVALAALRSPAFVVGAISNSLGLVFAGATSPQIQLLNALQDKQLLLVLDNLEHLLPPPSPLAHPVADTGDTGATNVEAIELLVAILEGTTQVKLLVTSREPLGIQGEWVFDLQGLPVPPPAPPHRTETILAKKPPPATEPGSAPFILDIKRYSSVALFVDSAQRVRPEFALTAQNATAVARICQLVEGMPLAIELAAAWVPVLSCEEIAEEIARNLDFLSVARRQVPERHRSVRAAFDYSWQLLPVEESQVLAQLAVFHGGFSREAAAQVASAPLLVLSGLVAKSLLQRVEAARFGLHELVRQYAGEKLAELHAVEQAERRHLDCFLKLAERAERELSGVDQLQWLDRLALEHDNLRAALSCALTQSDPSAALRLSSALRQFWEVRGYASEGRRWLDQALTRADQAPVALRVKALQAAGHLATEEHDVQAAQRYFEAALHLCRQLADPAALATALYNSGRVAWLQSDYPQARAQYEEALALRREQGDQAGVARTLNGLGLLVMSQGDFDGATAFLSESVALDKQLGNQKEVARSLFNLGMVSVRMPDGAGRATEYFEASVALCRQIGYQKIAAYALNNLAMLVLHSGDPGRAAALAQESLALCQEANDRLGASYALVNLGNSAVDLGDLTLAEEHFRASISLIYPLVVHSQRESALWVLEGMGRLAALQGQTGCAIQLIAAAAARRGAGDSFPSTAKHYLDQTLHMLRRQLDETYFVAQWAAGQAMTLEEAVALAFPAVRVGYIR